MPNVNQSQFKNHNSFNMEDNHLLLQQQPLQHQKMSQQMINVEMNYNLNSMLGLQQQQHSQSYLFASGQKSPFYFDHQQQNNQTKMCMTNFSNQANCRNTQSFNQNSSSMQFPLKRPIVGSGSNSSMNGVQKVNKFPSLSQNRYKNNQHQQQLSSIFAASCSSPDAIYSRKVFIGGLPPDIDESKFQKIS